MEIAIGSDHAGFDLKEQVIAYLKSKNFSVLDKGCYSAERTDYPDYGHAVANEVLNKNVLGIVICGSGNGINMTANKHKGIRSALCWTAEIAEMARLHNDANILTLPARYITEEEATKMCDIFYSTAFEGGRHTERVKKIAEGC